MKRCSPSLVTREMQIKTKVRYYYTPSQWDVKKMTDTNFWRGCRQWEQSSIAVVDLKWNSHLSKEFVASHKRKHAQRNAVEGRMRYQDTRSKIIKVKKKIPNW